MRKHGFKDGEYRRVEVITGHKRRRDWTAEEKAEIGPHKGHPAVRQLHMRRLDQHRQALQRNGLMASIELVRLARGKAQRHIGFCWQPRLVLAPRLYKPMHAVMCAVIATAAQLLEQTLRRATLATRQLRLPHQDLGQNRKAPPSRKDWFRTAKSISCLPLRLKYLCRIL
jgi:hypothetical protein